MLSQSHPDVDDITDPKQMEAAAVFDALTNQFWMDAFFKGKYSDRILDHFGERRCSRLLPVVTHG